MEDELNPEFDEVSPTVCPVCDSEDTEWNTEEFHCQNCGYVWR
jgi:transposase